METIKKNKKVFVAMSGGVDSSVAAALLKKEGFQVTGVFMKCWSGMRGECPWRKDQEDARKVASKLKIPFYAFNFEQAYRKKVVEWFIGEYKAGRTPNPDVVCNQEIKFGLFLEKALQLGADLIATGHHVRRQPKAPGPESPSKTYKLLKGVDKGKDQSYFLWILIQKRLRHTLFPIGQYSKKKVRQMAKSFGLHNWGRPDSQGICFIGEVNLFDFLRKFIRPKKGPIVTISGQKIGEHPGVAFYTIGQRHGLGIGGGQPYYVVDKDANTNTLIVSSKEDPRLYKKKLLAEKINWLSGETPRFPLQCQAKIRYLQPDQEVTILKASSLKVLFKQPQRAITPGQAVVFYQGSELLGGGVIKS